MPLRCAHLLGGATVTSGARIEVRLGGWLAGWLAGFPCARVRAQGSWRLAHCRLIVRGACGQAGGRACVRARSGKGGRVKS